MVRSQLLKGEHSFRGLGYVEINGLLVPICGSKYFNFSEGMAVRYREESVQLVRPEMELKAALPITIVKAGIGYTAQVFWNQHGRPRTKIDNNDVAVEGIPDVLTFGSFNSQWVVQSRAPFAIRWPEIILWDTPVPGLVYLLDSKSPFIFSSYFGYDSATINTEIYIP